MTALQIRAEKNNEITPSKPYSLRSSCCYSRGRRKKETQFAATGPQRQI